MKCQKREGNTVIYFMSNSSFLYDPQMYDLFNEDMFSAWII